MFIQRDDYHHCFKNDLKRFNINQVRHYTKEGSDIAYPSVTSILSFVNGPKFAKWRARVGEEEANRVTKQATTRGTNLHTLFEHFLLNDDYRSTKEYKIRHCFPKDHEIRKWVSDATNAIKQGEEPPKWVNKTEKNTSKYGASCEVAPFSEMNRGIHSSEYTSSLSILFSNTLMA